MIVALDLITRNPDLLMTLGVVRRAIGGWGLEAPRPIVGWGLEVRRATMGWGWDRAVHRPNVPRILNLTRSDR